MSKTNIGILWVDDPKSKDSLNPSTIKDAYICTGMSADDVERIPLTHLPQQYLWISNLTPDRFKYLSLSNYGHIKNSRFLGIAISQMAIDLALPDSLTEKMPILKYICQNIVDKIETDMGIPISKVEYAVVKNIHEKLFSNRFHERHLLKGESNKLLDFAIDNSMQKIQASTLRKMNHLHEVQAATFARTPYSLTLLNLLYPTSNDFHETSEFEGKTIGTTETTTATDNEDVMPKLIALSKTKCGFVNFTQHETRTHVGRYYPLGKELVATEARHWATLPEIIDMANYSTLTLGKAFITEGGRLANAPLLDEVGVNQTFASYTNGLMNQLMWQALSYDSDTQKSVSAVSVYIRSYDRIMCRLKADMFIEEQFDICGFGVGTIRFLVSKNDQSEKSRLKDAIIKHSMIPQLSMLQ